MYEILEEFIYHFKVILDVKRLQLNRALDDKTIKSSCSSLRFFFILNCAIGGNAAGQVDLNDGWTLVKNTATEKVYEDYFYIDYVRVYQ